MTPIQMAAVAAAQDGAGYDGSDSQTLYSLLNYCGSNDPTDYYATESDFSEEQVAELQALLVLRPKHPQSKKWRAGIAQSTKSLAAQKDGTQFYDGTYNVPKDVKRGTYVVKDVTDCYWETRDKKGQIISNGFVLAAPQVVAKISSTAVVFTAQGCGQWNRR